MVDAVDADHRAELTLAGLCRAANVSARTLHVVSMEHLGNSAGALSAPPPADPGARNAARRRAGRAVGHRRDEPERVLGHRARDDGVSEDVRPKPGGDAEQGAKVPDCLRRRTGRSVRTASDEAISFGDRFQRAIHVQQ